MKKLLLLIFTFTIGFNTVAQENFSKKSDLLFEAEAGIAIYGETDAPPLTSFQLRFGSVVHKYLSMGLLFSGFTATGPSVIKSQLGTYSEYITHGGRGGFFLRVTGGEESHFYAELQSTVGGIFQVAGNENIAFIQEDLEYGGGINIGYNIAFANSSYFGFYAGAEVGKWQEAGEGYLRYNLGLRFQVRH